jgi:hypothetical protein
LLNLQTVTGLNAIAWNADADVAISFCVAVALSCGHGIAYTDVTVSSVIELASSGALFLEPHRNTEILSSASSLLVNYVVSASVHGLGDSSAAFDNITSTLAANVGKGYFTSYLQAAGAANGVSALENATSSSLNIIVADSPTSSPTNLRRGHANNGFSTMDVVIIAVPSAVFIVGVAVCLWRRADAKKKRGDYVGAWLRV